MTQDLSATAPAPQYQQPDYYDDEIDLRELWRVIWAGKWRIVGITSVFAVGALVISLMLPNIYRSEVLLAPASEADRNGFAGLAGQFGGLASLAGVSLGGGSLGKAALALEIVKSRAFIAEFIEKHQLQVPLMASKGWDLNVGEWIVDANIYDVENSKWVREVAPPKRTEPSALEMHKAFLEQLSVTQAKDTGLVRIGFESQSPFEAQRWVDMLIQDLNEHMRKEDIDEANANISYLSDQLTKTAVMEMQKIFYQLIEQQMKTVMLAEVKDEYVFKVVDPAVVPENKTKPRRALICTLGALLGGMISVAIVLVGGSPARKIS